MKNAKEKIPVETDIKVYSPEQVAEILQVTTRTINNYIKAKTLKAVKIGKFWRVSDENLKEFIKNGAPIVKKNK